MKKYTLFLFAFAFVLGLFNINVNSVSAQTTSPTINSFTPAFGPVGTTIKVNGSGFAPSAMVFFMSVEAGGGLQVPATVVSSSEIQFVADIDPYSPFGAYYIVVANNYGSPFARSSTNFMLTELNPQIDYVYDSQFGTLGFSNGEFYLPSAVALDSSGNIYVADKRRVQKFNSSGVYQSQFGTVGSGNGQFSEPVALAIDSSNNIYVVDFSLNRVQKFNSSGVYLSQFGSAGSGNGQFNQPSDITIDSSGNIYIVETGNHRVQKFNSSGVYLSQFGSAGSGNGQFNQGVGIAHDSLNNIYVTDMANNRVQKFNSSGVYLSQFGTAGSGNGQFSQPTAINVDSSGNILVAEFGNHRVQKFNSSGVYQSQFGTAGAGDGQFVQAVGMTLDSSGNIYVVDFELGRVQKFTVTRPTVTLTSYIKGTGTGSISSTPELGSCNSTTKSCSVTVPKGTVVTLKSVNLPANSTFVGWSGACSGKNTCAVTVNADTSVTATFNLLRTILPTVEITASPNTISAGDKSNISWTSTNATVCNSSGNWPASRSNTRATSGSLSVNPTITSTYSLTCINSGGTGKTASTTVTVTPVIPTPQPVKVSLSIQGDGEITSSSNVQFVCDNSTVGYTNCTASIVPGTSVTFTESHDADNNIFGGWGGGMSGFEEGTSCSQTREKTFDATCTITIPNDPNTLIIGNFIQAPTKSTAPTSSLQNFLASVVLVAGIPWTWVIVFIALIIILIINYVVVNRKKGGK
ncbi:hypothetical protein A2738_01910 [Candidatus Nomurabacteria bacterium RIFCSPHIGHO2_01_FULL_42_15]|uniref:Bacterial repeat domain-containing protein n=1 Tax=Candidatus Nomurabacteria bacterium RIFCSPHIGHO2_01_FULL_42_15 TaxID=1801742 RepID=A0A1F6VG88_9BACT|nr:MAG: hypothetical protein A2738_01910 [Candidatus Nomurabacteria bacterium RIFCSPHIGHO2_01_FULL_42_15]OGI92960.1 MAG: hypothetical protein A3A99_00260 [Candidatus Nomurabacteria bacterium RIFCSPLOWO2_01_FULL_41_18]